MRPAPGCVLNTAPALHFTCKTSETIETKNSAPEIRLKPQLDKLPSNNHLKQEQ
jgi:hypothetical protein